MVSIHPGFVSFVSLGKVTIVPVMPNHLLPLVRYMGAHGCMPIEGVKDLFLFAVPRSVSRTDLGFIDDLGLLGKMGQRSNLAVRESYYFPKILLDSRGSFFGLNLLPLSDGGVRGLFILFLVY